MVQLCLIRHGETEWNRKRLIQGCSDIPLNETGLKQAHIVGRYVSRESWDAIYASPLKRAYDTAAIIAGYMEITKITTDPRLRERDFGDAEGMDIHLRRTNYGTGPIPGAETWPQVQQRAMEMLKQTAEDNPDSRLLVIAHGGLISSLLSLLSDDRINHHNNPLKNLCMNMLTYDGDWSIVWYNKVVPELELLENGV